LLGYHVVGFLPTNDLPAGNDHGSLRKLLTVYGASRLLLAVDSRSDDGRRLVKDAVRQGVPFSVLAHTEGVPVFGIEQVAFLGHDTVLLSFRNGGDRLVSRLAKTLFDVILASVLLFLLALPMGLIALLVKLDGGPALFGHDRIGVGGRTFKCFKFRTMVVNADAVLAELLARDPDARQEWNETQKLRHDPRVTRIGKVLRATSLDELPQLFNVLLMDMSLVGPRPIVQQEVHRYADDISYYYGTKPGLTGLWQVSGRSETTYSRRVHLDSWYVRNWSIWHDVAILLKTIPAVLYRQGAR
jgi:undecaprenyl-phosphate galactose phosphotransferase